MRIVIADDDPLIRRLLEATLNRWGHDVVAVANGIEACSLLTRVEPPCLAVLDWNMPGLDGPDVCRRVRQRRVDDAVYLILLTSNADKIDIVAGLASGANDYVTKPFDENELHARIEVGLRVLELQQRLADRIEELSRANARVHQLQGLLPICSYCKSIRNDQNYWQRVEHYICAHADVRFSHGICPSCLKGLITEAVPAIAGVG